MSFPSASSREVKTPRLEADLSFSSSAEAKNVWSLTSGPHPRLYYVHRKRFNLFRIKVVLKLTTLTEVKIRRSASPRRTDARQC
jgi:hypothetical protein